MPPMRLVVRGADDVIRNLHALGDQMPAALGRSLYRFAEVDITGPAKDEYAPVLTGALRSSLRTEQPEIGRRGARVVVAAGGAAASYAKIVHENPRAGQTGGTSPSGRRYKRWSRVGQWKFLETPAMLAASSGVGFVREAGAELEGVIRGLNR